LELIVEIILFDEFDIHDFDLLIIIVNMMILNLFLVIHLQILICNFDVTAILKKTNGKMQHV